MISITIFWFEIIIYLNFSTGVFVIATAKCLNKNLHDISIFFYFDFICKFLSK